MNVLFDSENLWIFILLCVVFSVIYALLEAPKYIKEMRAELDETVREMEERGCSW